MADEEEDAACALRFFTWKFFNETCIPILLQSLAVPGRQRMSPWWFQDTAVARAGKLAASMAVIQALFRGAGVSVADHAAHLRKVVASLDAKGHPCGDGTVNLMAPHACVLGAVNAVLVQAQQPAKKRRGGGGAGGA